MRNIFQNRKRLAIMSALTVGLFAGAGTFLVKPTKAFTLIEMTAFFAPVELIGLDTANVVVTNLSSQEVHVTINWGDVVSGASLAQFDGFILPGKGFITPMLPAINLPAVQRGVIAILHLSPAPGGAMLPPNAASQIAASINVVDGTTHKVTVSRGLSSVPAVQ